MTPTELDGLKIALETQRQLVAQINTLWNFFSVIALGVVGIIYGGVRFGSIGRARVPISVGFGVWALANASALSKAQGLLATLTTSINNAGKQTDTAAVLKPFLLQLYATPVWKVMVFHFLLDAIVLAAIWGPTLAGAAAQPTDD